MILELENERVVLALRNSLAMVLVAPGFTLLLGLLLAAMAALFVVTTLPAVLFLGSVWMLIANHATRSRLAAIQHKPYPPRS
jgi:ABC-type dipeptide/oligopeptide/nickel transport system permease subunit